MSSDSPSGGMKEIVRSFSKRDRRTHWWNFTSSIITVFPLSPKRNANGSISVGKSSQEAGAWEADAAKTAHLRPVRAKSTRSLRPSRSSGIPESMVFNLMLPTMSLLITLPLAFTWEHQRGKNWMPFYLRCDAQAENYTREQNIKPAIERIPHTHTYTHTLIIANGNRPSKNYICDVRRKDREICFLGAARTKFSQDISNVT